MSIRKAAACRPWLVAQISRAAFLNRRLVDDLGRLLGGRTKNLMPQAHRSRLRRFARRLGLRRFLPNRDDLRNSLKFGLFYPVALEFCFALDLTLALPPAPTATTTLAAALLGAALLAAALLAAFLAFAITFGTLTAFLALATPARTLPALAAAFSAAITLASRTIIITTAASAASATTIPPRAASFRISPVLATFFRPFLSLFRALARFFKPFVT